MNQHVQPDAQRPLGLVTAAVLRRWWLVVILAIIGAVAAYGLARREGKTYTATAALLFRDPGVDQKLFGSSANVSDQDPDRTAATNIKLITLPEVSTATAKRIGLSYGEVQSAISVASAGASDIVNVTAKTNDPNKSARIATNYVKAFIALRQSSDRATVKDAATLLTRQINALSRAGRGNSAQADQLRNRRDELNIIASLQTGDAELAQAAKVPGAPSGPKKKTDTAIGLILGLIIGIVAATVAFVVDRKLRRTEEIADAFDLPVIGTVPRDRALRDSSGTAWLSRHGVVEDFRSLRANLRYYGIDEALTSLLIASAADGEGKSTIALGLAANASRSGGASGARVLLIECDLRHPVLAERLGFVGPLPGLAQLLTGTASHSEVVRPYALPDGSSFDVVTAGDAAPNAAELLDSRQMGDFLEEMKAEYDLVLLDAPAIGVVSDAIPLATRVSGVLFVTRLRRTNLPDARDALSRLERVNARVLGVVVNGAQSRRGRAGRYQQKSLAGTAG